MQTQTVRHHMGRTYVLSLRGEGPFQGRFLMRGRTDGQLDNTAWHDLDEEWPDESKALDHADEVARQYITTFSEQA